MLRKTMHNIRPRKNDDKIIVGHKNLQIYTQLQNPGKIKKMTRNFIKQSVDGSRGNSLQYDKRQFVPFVDERDQLGRLIQSDFDECTKYTQLLALRKNANKVIQEIPDNQLKKGRISPLKDQAYYDKLQEIEYEKLHQSMVPVLSRNHQSKVDDVSTYQWKTNSPTKVSQKDQSEKYPMSKAQSFNSSKKQSRAQSSTMKFRISLYKNSNLQAKIENPETTKGQQCNTEELMPDGTDQFNFQFQKLNTQGLEQPPFFNQLSYQSGRTSAINLSFKKPNRSHLYSSNSPVRRTLALNNTQGNINKLESLSSNTKNQSVYRRKSQFRIKVFDHAKVIKQSEESRNVQKELEMTGGASLLFDMIVKNAQKRSGTASFKSSLDRGKSMGNKTQAPPLGYYHKEIENQTANKVIDIGKMKGRESQQSPDQQLRYKSLLDSANYSCFKHYQDRINGIDFARTQPRDDVSFLKNLAKFQMANKLGMDYLEFDQLWKQDKQGVYERLLMLRKS